MSFCMVRRKMLNSLVFQTNHRMQKYPWKEQWQNLCLWVKDANILTRNLAGQKAKDSLPPILLEYFFQGFENCRMTWKGVIKLCESPGVPQPGLTHSSSRHFKIKSPTE